jgi:hypothetical protein
MPIDKQRLGKHVSMEIDSWKPIHCWVINRRFLGYEKKRYFLCRSVPTLYNRRPVVVQIIPCAGGVEYLHCSPANRRRWRNGKSRIWSIKIWSWVPRDSDPRMIALARTSSYCKRQTSPLVGENAPHQQTHNCRDSNKNLVVSPRWMLYSKTDWPTDRRS